MSPGRPRAFVGLSALFILADVTGKLTSLSVCIFCYDKFQLCIDDCVYVCSDEPLDVDSIMYVFVHA